MTKKAGDWVILDSGTLWPLPRTENELEWRLRYAQNDLSVSELYHAASIVSAYQHMIENLSQKKRNAICEEMKRVLKK